MAATRGGPAAAAACIIGGAEAGWCWSERCGGREPGGDRKMVQSSSFICQRYQEAPLTAPPNSAHLLLPGTCPAAQALNWIQDMDTSVVPREQKHR